VSGSARLALNELPIFRALNGASFDSALMNLESLLERATAAALDRSDVEWMGELRANRLHSWLEKNLHKTMSHAPSLLLGRILFSLNVLSVLRLLDATKMEQEAASAEDRADKKRVPVMKSIDRLTDALDDGVVVLTHEKRSLLRQLLSEAKAELAAKRSKSEKHPGLVYLSQLLARTDKRARKEAILEVVDLTNIECDATTADRYADMAGRVGSSAVKLQHAMDRSDWHLLDVLEQNR
jgi:hypothetical protein